MSRLYFRVFEGPLVHPEDAHPHESPWEMWVPLAVLGGLSVVGGTINLPWDLRLEHYLEPVVGGFDVPHGATAWVLAGAALTIAVVGIALARYLYLTQPGIDLRGRLVPGSWLDRLIQAARAKFGVDEAYGAAFVVPGRKLSEFAAFTVDARGVDRVVTGTGGFLAFLADGLRRLQTGFVRTYAALFLLGVVAMWSRSCRCSC
jgi:NADH-quinone oxidoreductase subunit L